MYALEKRRLRFGSRTERLDDKMKWCVSWTKEEKPDIDVGVEALRAVIPGLKVKHKPGEPFSHTYLTAPRPKS